MFLDLLYILKMVTAWSTSIESIIFQVFILEEKWKNWVIHIVNFKISLELFLPRTITICLWKPLNENLWLQAHMWSMWMTVKLPDSCKDGPLSVTFNYWSLSMAFWIWIAILFSHYIVFLSFKLFYLRLFLSLVACARFFPSLIIPRIKSFWEDSIFLESLRTTEYIFPLCTSLTERYEIWLR